MNKKANRLPAHVVTEMQPKGAVRGPYYRCPKEPGGVRWYGWRFQPPHHCATDGCGARLTASVEYVPEFSKLIGYEFGTREGA